MGENYYIRSACDCCGETVHLHIGKSVFGLGFLFQGQPDYNLNTVDQWLAALESGDIIDDYYRVVPIEEFKNKLIKSALRKDLQPHDYIDEDFLFIDDYFS